MTSYLTVNNYKQYLIKHTKRTLTFEMFGMKYLIDHRKRCWLLVGRTSKYGYKTYGYILEPIPEGFEIFPNKMSQESFIKHFIRGKDNNGFLYRLTAEDQVRIREMKIKYYDDNKLNDPSSKEQYIQKMIRKGRKTLKGYKSLPPLHVPYNSSNEILEPLPKMISLKHVNDELKRLGYKEELVRDKANKYFYFWGGEADSWPSQGVYVARINHLTLDQWIEERNHLASKAGG